MDRNEELELIHDEAFLRLRNVERWVLSEAEEMLNQDIDDPARNDPASSERDDFMLRANELGRALLNAGMYSVAERLYRGLAKQTQQYRDHHGVKRHMGALNSNIASACFGIRNSAGVERTRDRLYFRWSLQFDCPRWGDLRISLPAAS